MAKGRRSGGDIQAERAQLKAAREWTRKCGQAVDEVARLESTMKDRITFTLACQQNGVDARCLRIQQL